jgi:hypothetical protein
LAHDKTAPDFASLHPGYEPRGYPPISHFETANEKKRGQAPPPRPVHHDRIGIVSSHQRSKFAAISLLSAGDIAGASVRAGAGTHAIGHEGTGDLIRVTGGRIAAGVAAFAIGFGIQFWLLPDAGPAMAVSRGDATYSGDAITPRASLGERFVFALPGESMRPSQALASFDDRFGSAAAASGATARSAAADPSPRATVTRSANAVAAPRLAQAARKPAPKGSFQLASASATSLPLAYAPDEKAKNLGIPNPTKGPAAKDSDPFAGLDAGKTAIYEITSHTVYLPNGRRLEAHSGLGSHMDDPRYVAMRNTGPTPPNVYALRMRESRFHGVRAIRLIPKDESKMNGRAGILAHSYMLGANGQSNGCVSFEDYSAFLDAYERGDVTHLVVVERLADSPLPKTASDWLPNMFKDFFRRS